MTTDSVSSFHPVFACQFLATVCADTNDGKLLQFEIEGILSWIVFISIFLSLFCFVIVYIYVLCQCTFW